MKKMMRRWISMLMVVLMTIAMVPMQAFAATCTATINFRVIPVYEDATKPLGYDVDYDSDWKGTISCTYTSTHSTNANHQIPIKEFHPDKVLSGKIRSGYTWKGWNKYNININSVNATYSASVSNSNTTSFSGTGTHYIYMVYKSNTPTYNYSLKYNLNGGTGNFPDQTENNSTATSKNFTIHSGTPNRDNFEFLGWSDGTTTYSITLTSAAPSKTLTAQWTSKQTEAPKFKVTYKDGDTTVLNSPLSYDKGSEVTVLGLEDKNDATFLGWNTTKGATTADWAEEDTFTINADMTFYAVWKAKETDPTDPTDPTNPTDPATEYTITYKNGDKTIDTVTVPAGGDANVRDGLTDDEKKFSYWLGDDENIYRPGDEITGIDKNYVLTAVWKGEEPDPDNPRDKVNKPGIDKKADNADRTVVKPGDIVNFTLESNVPDNLSDYVDWQAAPWNIVNPSTGDGGTTTEPESPESQETPESPETPVNPATVNGDVPAQYAEIARNNAGSTSGENKEITKGSYVLTFHDVMSDGLTMKDDTLKVTIDGKELSLEADDYTFITGTQKEGHECSFEISMDLVKLFNEKKFDLNTDTVVRKILVTYSATYNGTEGDAGDGFKSTNKAWVDYTDKNPDDPDTPDEVEVVTGSISVIKIDQDNTSKVLEGAEFELYADAEGTQKVGDTVTTGADGKASFGKLAAGTYYLKETKAPDGYVGREELQKVTITAKDGEYLVTYKVPNKYVPHTGGAGTRMFTILGLAIMAGAGVAFVISRRKRED